LTEQPATDPGKPAHRGRALLKSRDFLFFIAARFSFTLATQMLTVAVGWSVYELTRDPLDLGLVGLFQFAPAFALIPVTGLAADRFARRRVMASCTGVQTLVGAFFFLNAQFGGGAVWPIFLVLVLHGGARAFLQPASQAILPILVAKELFVNAVAYNSSAGKTAQLLGPVISGLLIAWIGGGVFLATSMLFLLATVSATMIGSRPTIPPKEPVGLQTVLGGFAYVWRRKIVLGAISIDLFAVLFGGVVGLLPVYARDILQVGPEGLGLMRSMPGVGALAVGLALSQLPPPRRSGTLLFVTLAIFGTSIVVFGLSSLFWLSLAALAVYGASDMVSVYIRASLVQIATPDDKRGRVSAVNSVFINASNELGDFRAGTMAAALGVVPAVVLGGAVTLGITALWWRLFPGLSRVDRLDDLPTED